MKILVFINSLGGGGAERVTANLSAAWVANGHEVVVVTLDRVAKDFYAVHPRVRRLSLALPSGSRGLFDSIRMNWRRITSLRRVIRNEHPDVVLGIMTRASVTAILATRGLSCRVIATEHNHPPMLSPGRLWSVLRYLTYRHASSVVALTRETRKWLEEKCRCANVHVIPNPLKWPIDSNAPNLPPAALLRPDRKLLLAIGRLAPQKGFDYLIDAFAQLSCRFAQWDLVILGEGKERASLEQQVAQHELDDRVFLPGRYGNVGDWYARADVYVLSSRFEGFAMTLAEAMASGVPGVSYDCEAGPRDIIDGEQSGLLVKPVGDVAALAGAMARVMDDVVLRARFARRATGVRARFSSTRVLGEWRELFASLGVRE